MGAPKLLGGVALIGSTVFYILPMSMHVVSARLCSCPVLSSSRHRKREREETEVPGLLKVQVRFARAVMCLESQGQR